MKTLLPALLTTALLSSNALANPMMEGHRIGLGFSSTDVEDVSWGSGLKVEYGYDFNHIFGLNVSYAQNKDSEYGLKLDGSTFKVDTDIGYKFDLDGFAIKPFIALGFARNSEKFSFDGYSETFNDTSMFFGFGARADINRHFYSEMRFDMPTFDSLEYDQFSWTFGYRF
ncbi:outer membrane beta-barrel protein [Vibrio astriarenae]|uniref:Outer membrane beta-barrel protein n=1 Tax=Vibrio astriarenae TaxID=1481923 RepID=A0A7Z2T5V7_9VIBR|nr:porin family protein [Vibrio astriarenae]QIA64826.1 outer membrane beta-barrel protein [Vibrio astriarenae]